MKKILIIENEDELVKLITGEFAKYPGMFDVAPKIVDDVERSLVNSGFMVDIICRNTDEAFQQVLDYYRDIDLFVIDAILANSDRFGVNFLNYIKKTNYRFGNFKYIIASGLLLEDLDKIVKMDFDRETQYVSKAEHDTEFPTRIVELAMNLFKLQPEAVVAAERKKLRFWKENWWIYLPREIEKNIVHRIVLLTLYSLILFTGVYAVVNIARETYDMLFPEKPHGPANKNAVASQLPEVAAYLRIDTFNDSTIVLHRVSQVSDVAGLSDTNPETNYLKYVERIFLYLLPIFIIFSFTSYYKSTIGIILMDGRPSGIDHEGAMKSLNNSKYILLSSLLSFTIISVIEQLFIKNQTKPALLFAYGIFIIILMIFIILQHKYSKEPKDKKSGG